MKEALALFQSLPTFKTVIHSQTRHVHLHGTVVSAGHERITTGDYSLNSMKRGDKPFAVLQLTLKGKGRYRYESEVYDLEPGSLMIAPVPHDNHYYIPRGSLYWYFVYIVITGSEFLRLTNEILETTGPVISLEDTPRICGFIMDILNHVQRKSANDEFYLSAMANRVLMTILSAQYYPQERKGGLSRGNPYVDFAERYCRERLSEPISIEEMSRAAGISRSHMSRVFTDVMGYPLKEFITLLRLEKAADLLLNTERNVGEIGQDCGYDDINYFCRAFKKHFADSPGQYRKRAFYLNG